MKKIKLFCLPYAGGSAAVYAKWKDLLHRSIDLQLLELRGRGRRIYEPQCENLSDTLDDLFKGIKDQLRFSPYAFFGHSLGALLAYELTWKIKENNLPGPVHILFSGRGAPQVPRKKDRKIFHLLPDDEFKEEVLKLGGTPKEFFDYPELMEILLPTLKNDFKISETYKFQHGDEVIPFEHDITVLMGKDEDTTAEHVFGWRLHSKKICSVHYFEGGHFFLHDETKKIVDIINDALVHR